jgi:hypothetical protein
MVDPLPVRTWKGRYALILIAALLFTLAFVRTAPSQAEETASPAPAQEPVTTIVVDTSADLNPGSNTQTCTYSSGAIFVPAPDGCTLRRAIREAAARPPADRPIAIVFNLANDDPNANLEVNGTWTLPITAALPPLRTASILNINGQVTIDGATQPGGRSNGPKIIINTNDFSLEVESENNVFRNLAFKGGGVIFLKEDGNTVENIWMGLSDDGQEIHFRTPGNPSRMAGGGVFISSDDNVVRNNVISGAFAKAVDVGFNSNNVIRDNLIGTRADGTVPNVPPAAQCLRSLTRDPQNWYGGWGIAINGSNNEVTGNRIAGLHILQTANATPPLAIEIFGTGHTISDNIIGVDSAGTKVGVCGQGIKVSGSNTQIVDNTITRSRTGFEDAEETAILASDTSPTFGQITVRRNLVEAGPGEIYAFGAGIPAVLRQFRPAEITSINGLEVRGGNGPGSPCPGCLIDFYLDNNDDVDEALSYLGSTVAAANGTFTFTLPAALAPGTGIRTSSTTQSAGVIGNYLAGTTTEFSPLYEPINRLYLPLLRR